MVRRMRIGRDFQAQSKAYAGLCREKTEELEEASLAGTEKGWNVV